VGIGVGVGVSQRNKEGNDNTQQRSGVESTKCNYAGNATAMPNVFLQCECEETISIWTDEVRTQYYSLRESFVPTILPEFSEEEDSCYPSNTALWQLSNDTLYGANATDNRYLLTLLYATWDGEGWRSKRGWLSTIISDCQWQGIECNSEGLTRSISLEANNLGGTIPSELGLMTSLRKSML
jgi:hypothetical protein